MVLTEDLQDFDEWHKSYIKHCADHECTSLPIMYRNCETVRHNYLSFIEIDNEFDELSEEDKDNVFQCVSVKVKEGGK